MPNHARCAVGHCGNDNRYKDQLIKQSHVEKLVFHKWPKDDKLAEIWRNQVARSRRDEFNPTPGAKGTFVCSNHFRLGKRTPQNPETDYPTVFLTVYHYLHSSTPKRRRSNALEEQRPYTPRRLDFDSPDISWDDTDSESSEDAADADAEQTTAAVPMQFTHLTRESDVKFFTGLPSTKAFHCLFEHLLPKVQHMQYWRGAKQTEREAPKDPSDFQEFAGRSETRMGPPRKLSLEQEFLLTLMKLRLGLLTEDLAFRFNVSSTTASSIFATWMKLCSKELSVLIIWPTRSQMKNHLPKCFQKLYPKVRCIIDCFECFTETPSGLDVAATMWSEYKHHYTFKALVAITPNGAISCVSSLWR